MRDLETDNSRNGLEIAIIGLAGRFPKARNVADFWRNLRDGVECVTFFSDEELVEAGVDPFLFNKSNYVKARSILEGVELFDAAFFGVSPREAEMTDPQHRVFLECAWHALENAGYVSEKYEGRIGVYGGTCTNSYLMNNLYPHQDSTLATLGLQAAIGNDKDYLATNVSYKLNLKGPSMSVQTACSTSLVAVSLACQSLLNYQCDMALAGGVTIRVPQAEGYLYVPDGIASPDGHTRVFDAQGQGTVFGNCAGIVVLKRLEDAIADGDTIHAVIKGSAVNNDGAMKVGFTAPGVEGQTEVVAMAQALAGIDVDTISYIEAHGTGTPLGDPIEIAALTQAFRTATDKTGFCAIGSVKTNLGHTDAAAGVAGLIKTVLALEHRQIPPSLHFETPNPKIDFAGSPFFVNTSLREWEQRGAAPRRAGVSSFGVGGTNAHVVLEEWVAPVRARAEQWDTGGGSELLVLSARTEGALERMTDELAQHLSEHEEELRLADVAHTLKVGRREFAHRRAVVSDSVADAAQTLKSRDPERLLMGKVEQDDRPVVFMFPGGGAQHVHMGAGLYQTEPVFREHVDRCAYLFQPHIGCDIREFIYPSEDVPPKPGKGLDAISLALPALFTIEYSLAQLWMSWGVRPKAMIGHSNGEYVAACVSGVLSLEDAIALVALRGNLFEKLPAGAMIAVPSTESEIRDYLGDELSIAAVNEPSLCIVAGPSAEIDKALERFAARGLECRRIRVPVASHTNMVLPILGEFSRFAEKVRFNSPEIPYVSNMTGNWVSEAEAHDPSYWTRHLRNTVRFADGLNVIFQQSSALLLEIGPSQSLSTLARRHPSRTRAHLVYSSMRHPQEELSDVAVLQQALGHAWVAGQQIDWAQQQHGKQMRVELPGYAFERQRYWIEGRASETAGGRAGDSRNGGAGKRADIAEWFYVPAWRRTAPMSLLTGQGHKAVESRRGQRWLIFVDECGIGEALVEKLRAAGAEVVSVREGPEFARVDAGTYRMQAREADYRALFDEIGDGGDEVRRIVHLWSVTGGEQRRSAQEWFDMILMLGRQLGKGAEEVMVLVVSNGVQEVSAQDRVEAEKAALLGACKVMAQEHMQVRSRHVDVDVAQWGNGDEEILDELLAECERDRAAVVAYRGGHRWAQSYEAVRLEGSNSDRSVLRRGGVYLITGGLGGIGKVLCEYLVRSVGARVVLVARREFPQREHWAEVASDELRRMEEWEREGGGNIEVKKADVGDEPAMRRIVSEAVARYGNIDGVIHAAGVTRGTAFFCPLAELAPNDVETQFRPKVDGVRVLDEVLKGVDVNFCLLFSSNAAILGGLGSGAYAAANSFMDSYVVNKSRVGGKLWTSINWDAWQPDEEGQQNILAGTSLGQYAMTAPEAIEALDRILENRVAGQVIVSTGDLTSRINLWLKRGYLKDAASTPQQTARHTGAVAPHNEIEGNIIAIWQKFLGTREIGIHDNFFELGGNSLIGVQVMAQIREELNVQISAVSLYQAPTVSSLARLIDGAAREEPKFDESRDRGQKRREQQRKRKVQQAR